MDASARAFKPKIVAPFTGAWMDKSVGPWLQRAARLHKARIAEALNDINLFPGQERTLLVLAEGEARTVGDIAEVLKVRPPTVSKTLARLAAQKLVERQEHGSDARKSTVHLTKEGARLAKILITRMGEVENALLTDLDSKDERRLRKLLKRVSRSLAGDGSVEVEAGDDEE
jgi:DNA-binding MarR family transcriptional regulator